MSVAYDQAGNLASIQAATSGVPVIVTQPFAQLEAPGSPLSISVNVSSGSPVTYQWQFNGQNISGATGATLLLPSFGPSNYGSYTVIVTNASGSVTSNSVDFILGVQPNLPVSFENGQGIDWMVMNGTWEMGVPTSGPSAAHSGSSCAGTVLGGNYASNQDSRLISPSFVVPAANQNPRLRWWSWLETINIADYGQVWIKVGTGNWTALPTTYSGAGRVWNQGQLDLSAYAGQTVQVGFNFHSDGSNVALGWYLDDITLVTGAVQTLVANTAHGFEAGWGDWSSEGGPWEQGVPTSGPNAAHEGSKVMATVLAGDYPEWSSYWNVYDTRLLSPVFTVPAANENPRLRFWQWYSFNIGPDYGEVQIRVDGGAWQTLTHYEGSGGGVWSQPSIDLSEGYAGQTVQLGFLFHAQDNNSSTGTNTAPGWYLDEVTMVTGAPQTLAPNVVESFESGLRDWYVTYGTWEVGVPTSGPSSAHSGTQVAATALGGNYGDNKDSRLVSPVFVVPAANENPRLRWWSWLETMGILDYGQVWIKVGAGSWTALPTIYSGPGRVWNQAQLDLSAYAGQIVQVGFNFHSDGSNVALGWYLDDIILVTGPLQTLVPNVADSFEAGWGDWFSEGGPWQQGTPTSGPNAAHDGSKVMATVLAGDYPEWSNYGNAADTRLVSPRFVMPAVNQNPRLRFWHWYSFNIGPDYGEVQIRVVDGSWQTLAHYEGSGGGVWSQPWIDLPAEYAGQTVQLAYLMHAQDNNTTSAINTAPGWYLDEVMIVTGAIPSSRYTDSLVAWWPGEGAASDAAGTHHGSLQGGATYAAGKTGQAFSLNGSTAMVQVPDSPDWAFGTGAFTIELWAKFGNSLSGRAFVASDQGAGNQNKWIFWFDAGGPRFHINSSGGSSNIGSATFVPDSNQWYHLAVTRSGSTYRFYINGSVVSVNNDSRLVPDANAPLSIGSTEGQFFFLGQLDEMSIYNRALSDAEIVAIKTAGAFGKTLTPLQTWRKNYFNTVLNSGTAGDNADPDFDGLTNLLEFATNLVPTASSTQPGQALRNGSNIEFTYTRSQEAVSAGVTFTVEWNDLLQIAGWSTAGTSETILSQDSTVQNIKATVPAGNSSSRFVHLKVLSP